MIFVDGLPLSTQYQEKKNLDALLEHPLLLSSSNSFKAMGEMKISVPEQPNSEKEEQSKHVYVFQREYATVDPTLVELAGTDEATTCVGLVIRNRASGMTSVAHMDSPGVVELGLSQMLSLLVDHDVEADLDVHLIGGFDDASDKSNTGFSLHLISKLLGVLQSGRQKFHLQTLCVLGNNTRRNSDGNACPIVNGFVVETSSGSIRPATFDISSRRPDEIVRRIRVTVSSMDPQWNGKLLDTYDTLHDKFQIAPCVWSPNWKNYASSLQHYSDSDILLQCSTSPSAEGSDFVENERRVFDYLIKYPNWRETFPRNRPRVFERIACGGWVRSE